MVSESAIGLGALLGEVGRGGGQTRILPGTCVYLDNKWRVYRGGIEVPNVIWLESASPRVGSCLLAVDVGSNGQSVTFVLGFTFASAYRLQDIGTIMASPSAGWVSVEPRSSPGVAIGARYFSHYTPATTDTVMLLWKGGEAYVIGKFPNGHAVTPNTPYPPNMPNLPARTPGSGVSQFPAVGARIWDTTLNGWAAVTTRDLRLTGTQYAVWSYEGGTKGLKDKPSITNITITLGSRMQTKEEPVSMTVNFYRSDATDLRTGGEPSVIDGPYPVVIPSTYNGGEIALPIGLGSSLKEGGSITMKAPGTIGFFDSPASGYLKVNWKNTES